MAGYKPYPEYKESGVEWLGKVPRHWSTVRLKHLAFIRNGKDYKDVVADEGYPVIGSGGEFAVASEYLYEGESVLLGRKGTIDRPLYMDGAFWTVDTMFYTEVNPSVSAKYLYYCALTINFGRYVTSTALPSMTQQDLGNIQFAVPVFEEQQTIARFLDHKTAQIDALIAKKQTLLEKLAEKRTALISHAVTKGLDPNVKMKNSGVEWLGQVPEHWGVVRLRFVVNKIEQGWSPQCENQPVDDGEWGVLKVGCVNGERFDASENKALPSDLEPKIQYEIKTGDILMSRANTKELLGSAALVNEVRGKLILCDKLYRFISGDNISNKYLVHILRSSLSRYQYEREATGASGSMQNIGQDTVKNLVFALPPIEEQLKIESQLEEVIARNEDAEKLAKAAIEKLQEYRSALITQAVTGKIDVCNVKIPQTTAKEQAA
jgi:type I restriction enzyme S subunit